MSFFLYCSFKSFRQVAFLFLKSFQIYFGLVNAQDVRVMMEEIGLQLTFLEDGAKTIDIPGRNFELARSMPIRVLPHERSTLMLGLARIVCHFANEVCQFTGLIGAERKFEAPEWRYH